jgi:hypothetical protein
MEALVNGQPAIVGDPARVTDPVLANKLAGDPSILVDASAAARALDAFRIQPYATEQALINTDWWFAGTCDLIATSPSFGDLPAILDYKFSRDVYPEYGLQTSAYNHMTNTIIETGGGTSKPVCTLGSMPDMRQDRAFVLHTRNGVASLVPVKTDGYVWEAVQAFIESWWLWVPTVKADSPVGTPLIQPLMREDHNDE